MEARAAFRRMLLRASALGLVLATVVVGVGGGAVVWSRHQQTDSVPSATSGDPAPVTSTAAGGARDSSTGAIQQSLPPDSSTSPAPVANPAPTTTPPTKVDSASRPSAPLTPGRTDLGEGITLERTAREVRVSFDTDGWRTRRRDKFETMLKKTLVAAYGPSVAAAVSALPPRFLDKAGDLITVLPSTGARLTLGDKVVMVWPETRSGRDGPLVVAYRTSLVDR